MTFQRAFGLFPRILGKGEGAKVFVRIYNGGRFS